MPFDLCVIGHVTQDRIEMAGQAPRRQPGGTAYYAGVTARRLGLRTAVVTRLHPDDCAALLAPLEALGVAVTALPSPATTTFVNVYPDARRETRHQRVEAVAAPFHADDLAVEAAVYLLGPLTKDEVPAACVRRLARTGSRVALDVQGLARAVRDGQVVPAPNDDLWTLLPHVEVVKAGIEEALLLTGTPTVEAAARRLGAAGPAEVLITAGRQGSYVFDGRRLFRIPAYPPARLADTTGCGDTYTAAYLARRLAGDAVERAGHFAAATASAKIAHYGAFGGTEAGVLHEYFSLTARST